jgi:copper chaperone CopZ
MLLMSGSPHTGMLATGGAMLSAIASSACCWLPLSLLAFGVSAGGMSAWFEHYRLPFLIASGTMLAIGFYLVCARAPKCEPGSACATTTRGSGRVTKVMLWASTVVIIAFAAFPKYVGALLPQSDPPAAIAGQTRTLEIGIEGMSCEACAIPLREALIKVPHVLDASVSYDDGTATLTVDAGESPAEETLSETVSGLGYTMSDSPVGQGDDPDGP